MLTLKEFNIGQEVMVPGRGLCTIQSLNTETILGQEISLAVLQPSRGKDLIKLPLDQLEKQGVRELATIEELEAAAENLGEILDLNDMDSVERIERWIELIREGDYGSRLQVLKELLVIEKAGNLTAREKKFKKKIHLAARREIEAVLETSASGAGRRLNLMLEG